MNVHFILVLLVLSIHIGIVETDGRSGVYDAEREMIRISLTVVIVFYIAIVGTV